MMIDDLWIDATPLVHRNEIFYDAGRFSGSVFVSLDIRREMAGRFTGGGRRGMAATQTQVGYLAKGWI